MLRNLFLGLYIISFLKETFYIYIAIISLGKFVFDIDCFNIYCIFERLFRVESLNQSERLQKYKQSNLFNNIV